MAELENLRPMFCYWIVWSGKALAYTATSWRFMGSLGIMQIVSTPWRNLPPVSSCSVTHIMHLRHSAIFFNLHCPSLWSHRSLVVLLRIGTDRTWFPLRPQLSHARKSTLASNQPPLLSHNQVWYGRHSHSTQPLSDPGHSNLAEKLQGFMTQIFFRINFPRSCCSTVLGVPRISPAWRTSSTVGLRHLGSPLFHLSWPLPL